jgi:hypothetical protein
MQFSPTFCHFISLRSKYFPQHPVLKHPHFSIPELLNMYKYITVIKYNLKLFQIYFFKTNLNKLMKYLTW